jgi:hypothetical protein
MGNRMTGAGGDIFGLSQALWQSVPVDLLQGRGDRDLGWMAGDDFTNFAADAAVSSSLGYYKSEGNSYKTFEIVGGGNNVAAFQPLETDWTVPAAYNLYSANGSSIIAAGTTVIPTPGQLKLALTTGNDQAQMVMGGDMARATATYPHGLFEPYPITSGLQGSVFFECRLQISQLATAITTFFIGLISTCVPATSVPCTTSGFSTVPGYLGFGVVPAANAGAIGMVWGRAGGAVQSHYMSSAMTPLNLMYLGGATGLGTIGTSTGASPLLYVAGPGGIPTATPATYIGSYFKLGFKYDPNSGGAGGMLTPYINGVAQDGRWGPNKTVTNTGIGGVLTYGGPGITSGTGANLWPNAPMTFGVGLFTTTSAQTVTIDWWRAAQLAY